MEPAIKDAAIPSRCGPSSPDPASAGRSASRSRVVRVVSRSAIPSTPPISRDVLVMADPSPARCGPTAFITAAVIGAIVEPIPWPMATKTGSIVR